MEKKHEHVFGGGMNLDIAPEVLPRGMSRHIYNARYDEFVGQMRGKLSNIRGTLQLGFEFYNKYIGTTVEYGALYSGRIISSNKFASSSDWAIPNETEALAIINLYGGTASAGPHLKEAGLLHWDVAGGDNSSKIGIVGSSYRGGNGIFGSGAKDLKKYAVIWTSTPETPAHDSYKAMVFNSDSDSVSLEFFDYATGAAVRFVRAATVDEIENLSDGDYCDDYIGNDLRRYKTVLAGNLVVMAENLAETMLSDGGIIPNIISTSLWYAIDDAIMCHFDNNPLFCTVDNYEYTEDSFPPGLNELVGTAKDYKNVSIILFIWNEEQYHSIYSVSLETYIISRVLVNLDVTSRWEFYMYFNRYEKITHANVIGDMLFWVSQTFPRKINLVRAKLFTHGDYVNGYSKITRATLSVAKPPPLSPPSVAYFDNLELRGNFIRGNTYAFRYLYVYDDEEESTTSPISAPLIPIGDFGADGATDNPFTNNSINIVIRTGSPDVKMVRLYVRENDNGLWALFKEIDKKTDEYSGLSYISVVYDGTLGYTLANQSTIGDQFSNVPISAKAQEYIDDKYIVYGQILEGFDYTTPDVQVDVEFNKKEAEGGDEDFDIEVVVNEVGFGYSDPYIAHIITTGTGEYEHAIGNIIMVDISFVKPSPNYHNMNSFHFKCISVVQSTNVIDIRNKLIQDIKDTIGDFWFASMQTESGQWVQNTAYQLYIGYTTGNNVVVHYHLFDITVTAQEIAPLGDIIGRTFKYGSESGLFLRYVDFAGRFGSTIKLPNIPNIWYSDLGGKPNVLTGDYNYTMMPKLTIRHLPPIDAVGYHIMITPPLNISTYVHVFAYFKESYSLDANYSSLDISSFQRIPTNVSEVNLSGYIFSVGDRVRFVTRVAEEVININNRAVDYYDVEVLGWGKKTVETIEIDDTDTLRISKITLTGVDLEVTEGYVLAEIYSVKKDDISDLSYEIGQYYNILNPGTSIRAHNGNNQEQDVVNDIPAIVTVIHGNTYLRYRQFQQTDTMPADFYFVESNCFSEFLKSDQSLCFGRIGVYSLLIKRQWQNLLRYSYPFFEDSNINGLSRFSLSDRYKNIENSSGEITGLVYAGYTLTVLQEKNNLSIYVGRSGLEQASVDGMDIVVSSDRVLSSTYPSMGRYGCIHPESIIAVDRNIYFYDNAKGQIIRKAPNGLVSLSAELGANSEMEVIYNIFRSGSGVSRVFSGYNQKYDELYFTFIYKEVESKAVILNKTLVFGAIESKFKYFIDLSNEKGEAISGFNWIGSSFVSFLGDKVYLHDKTDNYNTFYESKKPTRVRFVVNANIEKEKTFDAIAVYSNKKWETLSFENIITSPVDGYPLGMKTMLIASDFEFINGAYYSNIKMNAVLGAMPPSIVSMINGEPMRGNYMEIELVNFDDDNTWLSSVIVYFRPSEFSG